MKKKDEGETGMRKNIITKDPSPTPGGVIEVNINAALARAYADTVLRDAYERFKNAPSANTNWGDLQEAMLVFQQAHSGNPDKIALAIDDAPVRAWGELIVKAASGKTILQILRAEDE